MSADEDSSSGPLISEPENRMQNSNTIEALADIGDSSALMEESFNPLDIRDLQILLDNPQKHVTPFETYVSYRVTTKTTRADYSKPEYVERRRYSDFEWLRSHLAHSYPTHIIPPLPEKHTLFEQIDRYDKDFIQCRMQLLKRFLNRVADHPVLSCDKHFRGFLTESPSDFSALKKTSQNPGIFGRMSESLHNIATSYVAKDRTAEFEKINEYVCKLAEKIQTMEKIGQRLQKERQTYMQDMNQMHPLLSQWASSEQCLSKGLQAIGIASASCVEAQKTLIDGYKTDVAVPLHEYGLYTESAKASLNHRDGAQIDYEVHMEQLCRVKTEQNQLETQPISEQPVMFGLNMWRSPEEVQQQRLQQLTAASATLAQQVEASRDKMECSNENFRADFERWNTVKTRDFKSMLTEMADLHIQFYEQCLGAWATALPFVKAAGQ